MAQARATPYVFREYPKWITPPDGVARIVANQHEEILAMASDPASVAALNPVVDENRALQEQLIREKEEKAMLLQQLRDLRQGKPLHSATEALPVTPPAHVGPPSAQVRSTAGGTSEGERTQALGTSGGVPQTSAPGSPAAMLLGGAAPPPSAGNALKK